MDTEGSSGIIKGEIYFEGKNETEAKQVVKIRWLTFCYRRSERRHCSKTNDSKIKIQYSITEQLEATNQMWVRLMNNVHHQIDEFIVSELIYV